MVASTIVSSVKVAMSASMSIGGGGGGTTDTDLERLRLAARFMSLRATGATKPESMVRLSAGTGTDAGLRLSAGTGTGAELWRVTFDGYNYLCMSRLALVGLLEYQLACWRSQNFLFFSSQTSCLCLANTNCPLSGSHLA